MPGNLESLPALYGAAMVGLLITCFLSGIMTLQCYMFYKRAQKDPLSLKLLVGTVWTIDIIHLVAISQFVYHYVITNWGNMAIIGESTWTLGLEVMLNTWITFIVQMFFIHRVNILSKYHRWTLIPLYALAFVQLGFGTGTGIKSMLPQTVDHLATTRWRAGIWLISGAVNDILIAAILCYYLWSQRTLLSQRLIDQLIAYSINTGLLTSILAFIDIGCFIAMPGNYIHLAFNFVLGRIYANSLIASLNMRNHIRRSSNFRLNASSSSSGSGSGGTSLSAHIAHPGKVMLPFNRETMAVDGLAFYPGKPGDPQVETQPHTP